MCMCLSVYICHTCAIAHRSQKGLSPLELELQAVGSCPMRALRTELRSSGKVASALN